MCGILPGCHHVSVVLFSRTKSAQPFNISFSYNKTISTSSQMNTYFQTDSRHETSNEANITELEDIDISYASVWASPSSTLQPG
jgi:hypothetical protein